MKNFKILAKFWQNFEQNFEENWKKSAKTSSFHSIQGRIAELHG
jgi:ribosomal protein S17E